MDQNPQRNFTSAPTSWQSAAKPQANIFSPNVMPRHLPPADQPGQQQSPTGRFVPQPPGVPAGHLQHQVLPPGALARNGSQGYVQPQPPPQQQGAYPPQAYWQPVLAPQLSIPQMAPFPQFPPQQQQQQRYPPQAFPSLFPQQLQVPGAPNTYLQYPPPQNAAYWGPGNMVQPMHPMQQANPLQSPHPGQQGFPLQNVSPQSYMSPHPAHQQHVAHQPQQHVQQIPPPAKYEPGGQIERAFKKYATNGTLELKALASALDSLSFPAYTYESHLEIFKTADKDCSGNISLPEFLAIIQHLIGTSAFCRANNRRSLNVSSFRTALETLNIKFEYSVLINYFGKADGDQGCTIDEKEFIAVLSTIASENNITVDMMWRHLRKMPNSGITREMAEAAFSWADPTNKGHLDMSMLMKALKRLNLNSSYDEVKRLFPKFDLDESGHISLHEFVTQFTGGEASRTVPKAKYSAIKESR